MALLDDGTDTSDSPLFGTDSQSLNDLLSNGTTPDVQKLATQVATMKGQIAQAGYDPEQVDPRESWLQWGLHGLAAPGEGIRGIADTVLQGNLFGTDPKTGENIGTGFLRGVQRQTTTEDILREFHLENGPLRGLLGLPGDILTDPLTYITGGESATVGAAKYASRPITDVGENFFRTAGEWLGSQGVTDEVAKGNSLAEIARQVARYQEAGSKIMGSSDIDETMLHADVMRKASDYLQNTFGVPETAYDGQEIFKKAPLLKLGINVPFLGAATGEEGAGAREIVLNDPGPVGQALRQAGEIFTPAKFGVEITADDLKNAIPDSVVNAYDNISKYTNETLQKFSNVVASAANKENNPILGAPLRATGEIAQATYNAIVKASDTFKSVFNRAALQSADAYDAMMSYDDAQQWGRNAAKTKTIATLGEYADDKVSQHAAAEWIDAQAVDSLKKTAPIEGVPQAEDAKALFNRLKDATEVPEGDQLLLRDYVQQSGAEKEFGDRFVNLQADPNIPQPVKDLIRQSMSAMDDIAKSDAQNGIGYTRLEYYLMHKYQNAGLTDIVPNAPQGMIDMAKARKYATLTDAFKAKGYVGDTDLADLLQQRFQRSYTLQAQRRYLQRLNIESSLDPELVSKLYQKAILDPEGPAGQALKGYGVNVKGIDPALMAEGSARAVRQGLQEQAGRGDVEASARLAMADMKPGVMEKAHQELWAAGKVPENYKLPQFELGELGTLTKNRNGEDIFLPKPIADAYKETIAGQDLLKNSSFGQSAAGKTFIGAYDTASSFWKRWATMPFPAHWARHFTGGRFLESMSDIHNMDPGVLARTLSVLNGDSAIRSITGQILDRPALERVIDQFGFKFGANDLLSNVQAVSDMNVEKQIAMARPFTENVMGSMDGARRAAALEQAQNKMANGFDGYQRVVHFVNRFEKGDSIPDAARAAQNLYYNYRDMSQVEQSYFRRFFTFYGFMSKTTKRTLSDLITNPGAITGQIHAVDAMAEFMSQPNADPTADQYDNNLLHSVVSNEQLSRTIGTNPETGQPIRARGFGAPLNHVLEQFSLQMPRHFSVSELMGSAYDSGARTLQKQFAAANPAINAAAQWVTGKNLYFDKPLDSKFLRKLPDLTEGAKALAGFTHTDVPMILNDTVKEFLDAVPDGKGRMIVDPTKMWILTNIIPGFSRAMSMGGAFANEDVPASAAWLKTAAGIQLDDSDPTRGALSSTRDKAEQFMKDKSIKDQLLQAQD